MPLEGFRNALFSIPIVWGLAACIGDSGKEPTPVGANYLDPKPNDCTEFTRYDFRDGEMQAWEYFQVFFRRKNDSLIAIDEMTYTPKLRAANFSGSRSSEINVTKPTGPGQPTVFGSDLYFAYQDRYRDLDEVRKTAAENLPLNGLLPESNARKTGYLAPFRYGNFDLDTAYILINGDLDNQEWAYAMIFRKNGELILSYRFQLTGPAQGNIPWIIEETRTRCDTAYIEPDPSGFP